MVLTKTNGRRHSNSAYLPSIIIEIAVMVPGLFSLPLADVTVTSTVTDVLTSTQVHTVTHTLTHTVMVQATPKPEPGVFL